MARILLSKNENDFLREILFFSMQTFVREIEADNTLLETCTDDMRFSYLEMLRRDEERLSTARDIYNNLLSNL